MYAGTSLSARERLRRSKSTRSIRKSRQSSSGESFDADVGRQHALAAASLAMRRSLERSSTESHASQDRWRDSESKYPQKRHSIADDLYKEKQSPSPPPPPTRAPPPRPRDAYPTAALPSISEFYGLDGRNSSLPSSYRRLRKSRSMFSTRQRSSRPAYAQSSESHPQTTADRLQSACTPHSQGSLQRSMSFLRGGYQSNNQNSLRHAKSHDTAIQLARAQFQQSLTSQDTRTRHSSFSLVASKRGHRSFRKTFRAISTSRIEATTPPTSGLSTSVPSHKRTRAISSSIKKGIKRVLGLRADGCDKENVPVSPPLPRRWAQELSSPASGMGDYPETVSVRSPHSRSPVRAKPSSASVASSRSRVTSWADSTVANTITTRQTGHHGHMSVIDEASGLPRMPEFSPSEFSPSKSPNGIDSQSLFAALMKRIGKSSPQSPGEEVALGQVKQHRAVPHQSTTHLRSWASRRTIRHIPSEETLASPGSFRTAKCSMMTPGMPPRAQSRPLPCVLGLQDARPDSPHATRSPNPKDWSRSPSVYSRTASGRPTPKPKADNASSSGSDADEPGVATIFASQRSTYCSPGRSSNLGGTGAATAASIQPSLDWQQWMQSQIASIEIENPAREHYREDAQIHDEPSHCAPTVAASLPETRPQDDTDLSGSVGRSGSNFSRPFSRSSSVRTTVKGRKEPTSSHGVPARMNLPAKAPIRGNSNGYSLYINRTRNRDSKLPLSPTASSSAHRMAMPDSPTPRREPAELSPRWFDSAHTSRYPSRRQPIIPDDRAQQLRSTRVPRDHNRRTTNENLRLDAKPSHLHGVSPSKDVTSTMSSKRMVEMFLNSRRRQTGTGLSERGPEDAFV
ncbi:hypothetical protein P168DRAFT_104615 [Aspergillus campestris IBT 28561]|uniref:Uncharacterized protein n=1 Tax=Aspergillus campestris (strain IBT 28561) TaxID=1392248 RepID=A0A2I1D8J0_ASPC2|nr:uncharacterized protein P168DRAFT_104615 [Aspergillus campestris IBT 28561]PKY06189.1 hypothetical protein P168DRAFT_104615 [Aspergillus campestris IBT 28561]